MFKQTLKTRLNFARVRLVFRISFEDDSGLSDG